MKKIALFAALTLLACKSKNNNTSTSPQLEEDSQTAPDWKTQYGSYPKTIQGTRDAAAKIRSLVATLSPHDQLELFLHHEEVMETAAEYFHSEFREIDEYEKLLSLMVQAQRDPNTKLPAADEMLTDIVSLADASIVPTHVGEGYYELMFRRSHFLKHQGALFSPSTRTAIAAQLSCEKGTEYSDGAWIGTMTDLEKGFRLIEEIPQKDIQATAQNFCWKSVFKLCSIESICPPSVKTFLRQRKGSHSFVNEFIVATKDFTRDLPKQELNLFMKRSFAR